MTPNPKNIGAAPEEYPIRARVRSDAKQNIHVYMPQPGSEIRVQRSGSNLYWCSGGFAWFPSSLDILPDAVGVPEPSPAKGPSEVTQPGEGVDLEAAGLWLSHDNQDKLTVAYGKALIAEVRSLRATLRRESK